VKTRSEDDRSLAGIEEAFAREQRERARLEELDRRGQLVAETLQRRLLPAALMDVEGLALEARYLPGGAEADIGGDWYDVFAGAAGRTIAVVGDVGAKGVLAAAQMGQLRSVVRALGMGAESPAELIAAVNRFLRDDDAPYATLAAVMVEPMTAVCRFAVAGHPPPLVVDTAGRAWFAEGGRNLPLGADPGSRADDATLRLERGASIVLYTDGLVESRRRPLDEGLERLRRAAVSARASDAAFLDGLTSRVLSADDPLCDDVAVLAVTVEHQRGPTAVGRGAAGLR
jgi:serine phosphatase RsbU (regulator of sigma subunit)